MKIMHSRLPEVAFTVPLRGGYRAHFEGHRAVVPGDVADFLLSMGAGFYTLTGEVEEALVPGASVLVIRDTGLGDVLLLTPLLRKLASEKGCIVDVLTQERNRCLFGGNPHVRQTLALQNEPIDRSAYDVVLDLRLVVENAEFTGTFDHRADAFARHAGFALTSSERTLDYFVNGDERAAAMRLIEDLRACRALRGVVAYVLRSSTENRNWSEETHRRVIAALGAAGWAVILLDGQRQPLELEMDCPDFDNRLLNWTGMLTVREVAAIMEQCDAVITPDTGLFHLAGALNKPTLAYFGAFPAEERHAHRSLTVWNAPEKCSLFPCRSYRCLNRDESGQSQCLTVSPSQVVSDMNRILEKEANHVTATSVTS